jgi:CubicO group peptidase (beta-lactamase class C family)
VTPPSYREALASSAFARRSVPPNAPIRLRDGQLPKDDLQEALHEWVADNPEVAKANVGLIVQGQVWFASSNDDGNPSGIRTTQPFTVHSLTKTFTLALVLREIEAGRIALDQPMPVIRGIRRPPAALTITPRHLLTHSSGLADYTASPYFVEQRTYTPHQAVNLSLAQPLKHPVGASVHYANSNFFYLGLLLEQVTGRPYRDLVAELASSAGLHHTAVGPDRPGWVGFSSGGVESTVADLTRWGAALFTPDRIVPAARLQEATTLGAHNLGLGLWPLCPCWTDATGRRRSTAIGHEVGYGALMQYPQQMTLFVLLDPPGPLLTPHVEGLGEALRDVLRR